ncbi:9465_t:CDS:1, partial [Ambispora gerdemannii]
PIILLTVFLMFVVVIAQATPTPVAKKEKIGKNLYLDGVRFEGYYKKIAHELLKVHHQYNSLFSSFNGTIKEAAKKDNLPVPEFFIDWNEKYIDEANQAHQIYLVFIAKLESFRKKIEEAYKHNK